MVFFSCTRNCWCFCMSFFCMSFFRGMCFFCSTRNYRSFCMSFFTCRRNCWCSFMVFFSMTSFWCFSVFFCSTRSYWFYWCNRCYRSFYITTSSGTLSRSGFFFSWSYSMRSVICTRVIRGCIFFFIFRFISYNIVFCFDLV